MISPIPLPMLCRSAPAGTEVVFVCASRGGPPRRAEVEASLESLAPWPELPDGKVLEFDNGGARLMAQTEIRTRSPGQEYRDRPMVDALRRANALTTALAKRLPLVCGVAFAHVATSEP